MDVDNLKVVKIIDAMYCVRCNFAYVADVLLTDGTRKKMFYCARRDCDNWKTEDAAQPDIRIEGSVFTQEDSVTEP